MTENLYDRLNSNGERELRCVKEDNRRLIVSNEALVKKLETERTNFRTFRERVQELNKKVVLLRNSRSSPLNSPTTQTEHKTNILDAFIQCDVARLEAEKAILEYDLCEKNTQVDFLNSDLISCKHKLAHKIENTNSSEISRFRTKLLLKDQQLGETKSNCLKLKYENEQLTLMRQHSNPTNGYPRNHMTTDFADNSTNSTEVRTKLEELELIIVELQVAKKTLVSELTQEKNKVEQISRANELEIERLKTEVNSYENSFKIPKEICHFQPVEQSIHKKTESELKLSASEDKKNKSEKRCGMVKPIVSPGGPKGVVVPRFRFISEETPSSSKSKELFTRNLSSEFLKPEPSVPFGTLPTVYSDRTPQIIPIPNSTNKTPARIHFRPPIILSVVKLKSLCGKTVFSKQCPVRQVICMVNEQYELGVIVDVFELETRLGSRYAMSHFAGISLYNPVGDSNGTFRGKRHFQCEENSGVFVPYDEVLVPVS